MYIFLNFQNYCFSRNQQNFVSQKIRKAELVIVHMLQHKITMSIVLQIFHNQCCK